MTKFFQRSIELHAAHQPTTNCQISLKDYSSLLFCNKAENLINKFEVVVD